MERNANKTGGTENGQEWQILTETAEQPKQNQELAKLKIQVPDWYEKVEQQNNYPEITWDLLDDSLSGNMQNTPVLADLDKGLAKRYRELQDQSGVNFRPFTIATIESLIDKQEDSLDFSSLSDESIVRLASLMEATGEGLEQLSNKFKTEAEIEKYCDNFTALCAAFTEKIDSYEELGNTEKATEVKDGAGMFLRNFAHNYQPGVKYDAGKISEIAELLGASENLSLGMLYQHDFDFIDVNQAACTSLVKGRDLEEVRNYLKIRQKVSRIYDEIASGDTINSTPSQYDATITIALNRMYEADQAFSEAEDSTAKLKELQTDFDEISAVWLGKDGEKPTHNYSALLKICAPELAERYQKIAQEHNISTKNTEMLIVEVITGDPEAKSDIESLPDHTLWKLAEIQGPLDLKHFAVFDGYSLLLREKEVNALYDNMNTLRAGLQDIDGMSQNITDIFVRRMTSVNSRMIPQNLNAAKRLCQLADDFTDGRGTDTTKAAFIEQVFHEYQNSPYSLDEIMEYYRVGREVQGKHSGFALSVLQDAFRGRTIKPKDLSDYQEKTAPLVSEMGEDLSELEDRKIRGLIRRYGMAKDTILGLKDQIIPLERSGDKTEAESLMRWWNNEPQLRGEDRLMDFEVSCLTSRICPAKINQLMMKYRNLPTSDLQRLEQNRIDALAIERVVINNHTFIHNESPLTNRILTAMVDYYDAQGTPRAEMTEAELQKVIAESQVDTRGGYGNLEATVFNLDNYNKRISGQIRDDRHVAIYDEPTIDILRRLVANTKHNELEVPQTQDKTLNQLMAQVKAHEDLETGEMRVDWREVSLLTAYTNKLLLDSQGTIGIKPAMMKAIAYTERMATFAMRGITQQDWKELPYDPGFKEMVKFRELIGQTGDFSEQGFEDFWQGFQNLGVDPDTEKIRDNYTKLQRRIFGRLSSLAKQYISDGKPEYVGALWSGNLAHELVGLTDIPQPRTLRERNSLT